MAERSRRSTAGNRQRYSEDVYAGDDNDEDYAYEDEEDLKPKKRPRQPPAEKKPREKKPRAPVIKLTVAQLQTQKTKQEQRLLDKYEQLKTLQDAARRKPAAEEFDPTAAAEEATKEALAMAKQAMAEEGEGWMEDKRPMHKPSSRRGPSGRGGGGRGGGGGGGRAAAAAAANPSSPRYDDMDTT